MCICKLFRDFNLDFDSRLVGFVQSTNLVDVVGNLNSLHSVIRFVFLMLDSFQLPLRGPQPKLGEQCLGDGWDPNLCLGSRLQP